MAAPKAPIAPTIPESVKKELTLDATLTDLLPDAIDAKGPGGRLKDGTTLSLVSGTKEHAELNKITSQQGVEISEK